MNPRNCRFGEEIVQSLKGCLIKVPPSWICNICWIEASPVNVALQLVNCASATLRHTGWPSRGAPQSTGTECCTSILGPQKVVDAKVIHSLSSPRAWSGLPLAACDVLAVPGTRWERPNLFPLNHQRGPNYPRPRAETQPDVTVPRQHHNAAPASLQQHLRQQLRAAPRARPVGRIAFQHRSHGVSSPSGATGRGV